MPELIVSKNKKVFFRVPLTQKGLTIGRSSKNDFTLPDEDISRSHAEIHFKDAGYLLKDLSTGGTWIGSTRIETEAPLVDKNVIGIGDWKLTFKERSSLDEDFEKEIATCITRVKHDEATKVIKFDPSQDKFIVEKPFLAVFEDGKESEKYFLKSPITLVGNSQESDIRINDEFVSAKHCQIERTENGYYLEDLNSTNGTFIGDHRIDRISLKKPTQIKLGKSTLLFDGENVEEPVVPVAENQFCGLVGQTPAMRTLFAKIGRVAPFEETVLIQGETGCGKELVAHALHQLSPRNNKPYIILNCGAISPNLIESELFGHEKGAYTGAIARRLGAFEQANGGTLFLDEIGELPLELQPKLLRVLENRTVRRVGGDTEIPVNVRFIAATHRHLKNRVKEGRFREDLYFRLFVIPLFIPPLRERSDDLDLLVKHFIGQASIERLLDFSPDAMQKLKSYNWPGNIRELKNVVLRSLIFCEGEVIEPGQIEFLNENDSEPDKLNLDLMEREKIVEVLRKTGGNKAKAADLLGIAKSTLFKKLKEYDI